MGCQRDAARSEHLDDQRPIPLHVFRPYVHTYGNILIMLGFGLFAGANIVAFEMIQIPPLALARRVIHQ